MKLILISCILAYLAICGQCVQNELGLDTPREGILDGYEGESPEFDYESLQWQKREFDEVEGDPEREKDYDEQFLDQDGRPSNPSPDVIKHCYETEKDSVEALAKRGGLDVNSVSFPLQSPFVYYLDKYTYKPYLKCCPKVWNYGCRHINHRLPCFHNYYKNQKEWCCPLWPKLTVAQCVCDNCALMTKTCIHKGRCQRRYKKRSFLAVCYRKGWNYLRFFNRWLASTCYCRLG